MSLHNDFYSANFAEFLESIKTLYLVDERFRMICDEYCESKFNIQKYSKKLEKNFNHICKSENLSKELEEEIVIYIIRKY